MTEPEALERIVKALESIAESLEPKDQCSHTWFWQGLELDACFDCGSRNKP